MKTRQVIPLFIIEEHHEAFIVWNYAIQQGWMPATGNCLFHVDEHSDMGTPRFNESILMLNGDMEQIKRFTYSELNIASFIMPACYRDIINKVYWIRQKHRKTFNRPVKMFVRSYNQSGKRLLSGRVKALKANTDDPDKRNFDYYLRTLDQIPSNQKVLLDIDLDYFSCSGNPNELEEIHIKITKDEYESFIANKYHRLRYCGFGKIDVLEKDKNYFYVVNNYAEIYPTDTKVDERIIKERIDHFIHLLKKEKVVPLIIDICRSRYSGYTPNDQWEFIEKNVIDKLNEIYPISLKVL
jgi:hypothetical protein